MHANQKFIHSPDFCYSTPPPRPVPRPGDSDSLGPRGPGMDIFNQEVMIWVQREKLPYLVWHLQ